MDFKDNSEEYFNLREEFLRYFSFWPFFIVSIIFTVGLAFIYLRYADYKYESSARIEIIDKAQDSEMALPTAMTIFNRSMINLDNETGVLASYSIHENVVKTLQSNISFYNKGAVKTSLQHPDKWFKNYDFIIKINPSNISNHAMFELILNKDKMLVNYFDQNDKLIKSYSFDGNTTESKIHDLPFDLTINDKISNEIIKLIKFSPFDDVISRFRNDVKIQNVTKDSDQLILKLTHSNQYIANDYLDQLIYEFDQDGITDRQQEYNRTMKFIDSRSVFLEEELKQIENNKQNFLEKNNLTNIDFDATISMNQQTGYESELFNVTSQKDLLQLLKEEFTSNEFSLIPMNIGIDNITINNMIIEYNNLIKDREKFLISAGRNNTYIKNLERQIKNFSENFQQSINNYDRSLNLQIKSLEKKESQYASVYKTIPENQKVLRSIQRKLEVKEALYLLLLQKREEAAINYAVVKPSIKVIDSAMTEKYPVTPRPKVIILSSIFIGFLIPFLYFYFKFLFDNKIHTKKHLEEILNNLNVVCEIPYLNNETETNQINPPNSRSPLSESIRMLVANLGFILFNRNSKENVKKNVILVTSSIKGEGKTLISVNTASILSNKFTKVILIGADLRNPQIHKYIDKNKSEIGLSNYILKDDINYKDIIHKNGNLDIILSGSIPPNPTELLSSSKFKEFLTVVSKEYDYVIVDSAPCLLVSDTFEISDYVDCTLYVVRSGYTEKNIADFINENKRLNKLKDINIILNSIGNSSSYGYKYGYQYGYKYGYKYGYNYGYGYGYQEDK